MIWKSNLNIFKNEILSNIEYNELYNIILNNIKKSKDFIKYYEYSLCYEIIICHKNIRIFYQYINNICNHFSLKSFSNKDFYNIINNILKNFNKILNILILLKNLKINSSFFNEEINHLIDLNKNVDIFKIKPFKLNIDNYLFNEEEIIYLAENIQNIINENFDCLNKNIISKKSIDFNVLNKFLLLKNKIDDFLNLNNSLKGGNNYYKQKYLKYKLKYFNKKK